jgi:hypothetical protein
MARARQGVADQVGRLLWDAPETPPADADGEDDDGDDGTAGVPVPA